MFYETGYVANLVDFIFEKVFVDPTPYTNAVLAIPIPEELILQFGQPYKEEVIASYVTRFYQGLDKKKSHIASIRKPCADVQMSWNDDLDSASQKPQHQLTKLWWARYWQQIKTIGQDVKSCIN